MSIFPPLSPISFRFANLFSALALACCSFPLGAQQVSPIEDQPSVQAVSLPESPGSTLHLVADAAGPVTTASVSSSSISGSATANTGIDPDRSAGTPTRPVAPATHLLILDNQQAVKLDGAGKVRLGLRNAATPFAAVGWISATLYSQAVDSAPNYGQGWKPLAQRLGAAAARGSSEELLSNAVFAPLFHEDPRYYVLGRSHKPLHRVLYAASRTIITRSDNGNSTPNFSLLAGNAAGSILTNAYYPDKNRNATVTAETFAGAIGGSALGFGIREFISDALAAVHLTSIE